MLALLDGDILAYRTAWTCNEEDMKGIARARMNETITSVLSEVAAKTFTIFLSDSKENFRRHLFPEYKANRTQPKPIHLEYLVNILLSEWDAEVAVEEEADDALGYTQKADHTTCICSIDKDLHQVPGLHYNWVSGKSRRIGELEGLCNFYAQLLTGDSTDNVCIKTGLSCPGVGPVKAQALLEGCSNELEMWDQVCTAYYKALKDTHSVTEIQDRILMTGQLLKIRQTKGEIWNFPSQPNFTAA